jgi:hypothetical protein
MRAFTRRELQKKARAKQAYIQYCDALAGLRFSLRVRIAWRIFCGYQYKNGE